MTDIHTLPPEIIGRVRVDVQGKPSLGFVIESDAPPEIVARLFRGLARSTHDTIFGFPAGNYPV